MARSTGWLLFLFLSIPGLPAVAGGLDDADARLYQAQLGLAQQGNPRAQYFLGEMYEQGLGTKQDTAEAFKWYNKAAQSGDVLAQRKLSMRKEFATEMKTEKAPETASPPTAAGQTLPSPTQTARTGSAQAEEEETKRQQAFLAAREKRRAQVRAMILDRMRHPHGEPFE